MRKVLLIVALCICCYALTGCIESTFQLADSSKLPKRITIPPDLTRADVSVTMDYYTSPLGGSAKFILKDKNNGNTLEKIKGEAIGLYPSHLNKSSSGFAPKYPAYESITVSGITEIIEHKKMEPKFYVSDDPAVRKTVLADSKGLK